MNEVKNEQKSIGRSKGRNILIGVIVLVIVIAVCVSLFIRQAAESTMNVTGTISLDRQYMMSGMNRDGSFNRSQYVGMNNGSSSLSLEEYQKYAEAASVKDFYYSLTVSVNGTEDFTPVSTEMHSDTSREQDSFGRMDGRNGGSSAMSRFGMYGDFTIVGYSSDAAMTSFVDGTASISDGSVFEENTANYDCIISEELASFNNLNVGDTIKVANPNNVEEVYELNIVGLYTDSSANDSNSSMMGMAANNPANRIYMSYTAFQSIINASESVSEVVVDENTGMKYESALTGTLSGTYVFADEDAYYQFEKDVRELGLDERYAVYSSNLASDENGLTR